MLEGMPPTEGFHAGREGTSPRGESDEIARVVVDLKRRGIDPHCVHCGYNLRGLATDGRCPECGALIAPSLRNDLLSVADSGWLSRVHRGLTLIYAVFVTFLPSSTVLVVVGIPVIRAGSATPTRTVILVLFAALPIAAGISLLLGIFWLTTADPRLSLAEQPIVLRRVVRGAAIAALLLTALHYGLKLFVTVFPGLWLSASRPVNPLFQLVALWTLACAVAFTWVTASLYLAHLCERIPNIELAKRTKSRARVFAVFFAISILVPALDFALAEGYRPLPARPFLFIIIGLIGGVGSLIYGISLIIVWFSYRKPIKRCLRFAKS